MRITRSVLAQLESALDFMHSARRAALCAGLQALLSGGVATLTEMGRAVGSRHDKHGIKRMDRLLGNPGLHGELDWVGQAMVGWLLRDQQRPVVLVDWTELVCGRVALRAAVALDGRAVPIFATVHPKRLLSSRAVERRFLRRLQAILPDGCRPVVVTDAGFRGPWFLEVRQLGWDFVGRLNAGVGVRPVSGRHWCAVKSLFARATSRPRSLGRYFVRKNNSFEARIILCDQRSPRARRRHSRRKSSGPLGKRKCSIRARQPWVLVTSLDKPAKVLVRLYRTRMQVEELFRDDKNARWGWSLERSRTQDCKRLEVLLTLLATASIVVLMAGWAAEQRHLHRHYQANTRRRRVLSLQLLGRRVLHHPPDGFQLTQRDLRIFSRALVQL